MCRMVDVEEAERIYNAVELNPGVIPAAIAQLLDCPRSTVMRRLPALEDFQLLLWEDDAGRLYTFHLSGERGCPYV